MVLRVNPRFGFSQFQQEVLDVFLDSAKGCCIHQIVRLNEKLNIDDANLGRSNNRHRDPRIPVVMLVGKWEAYFAFHFSIPCLDVVVHVSGAGDR